MYEEQQEERYHHEGRKIMSPNYVPMYQEGYCYEIIISDGVKVIGKLIKVTKFALNFEEYYWNEQEEKFTPNGRKPWVNRPSIAVTYRLDEQEFRGD